jgi:hypothetical protein
MAESCHVKVIHSQPFKGSVLTQDASASQGSISAIAEKRDRLTPEMLVIVRTRTVKGAIPLVSSRFEVVAIE